MCHKYTVWPVLCWARLCIEGVWAAAYIGEYHYVYTRLCGMTQQRRVFIQQRLYHVRAGKMVTRTSAVAMGPMCFLQT